MIVLLSIPCASMALSHQETGGLEVVEREKGLYEHARALPWVQPRDD